MIRRLTFCLAACFAATAFSEAPDSWPSFHGRDSQGHVSQGTIPSVWSESSYAWKRDLKSKDVGSPVVFDGKVYYLTSAPSKATISLEAVDLNSGQLHWQSEFEHPSHHLHTRNTFASSTPAVDEKSIFVAWSSPEHTYLKCFDHAGNEVWSRDFGTWQSQHGFGTSPRIVGSMVLLFNSQQADQLKPGDVAGQSRVIAVDRETGKTVWETKLSTTRTCYGIPAVYQSKSGKLQIVCANKGNGMFGIDADSGNLAWSLEVFGMRCCSTPLIVDDIAIGSSGSGGGGNHLVAVRIPEPGQKPEEVYRIERGAPYVPTPAIKDDLMFLISDKGGIASCVNAKTGKTLWAKRLGGNFGASPIVVGDKLLLVSLTGLATVLKASDEYEKLGEIDLGDSVGATPAFADDKLLLRIGSQLCCLPTE